MKKAWVHIRYFIKFVPIKLVGVFFSIIGFGIALASYFLFGFSNFLFVWMLMSLFFLPLAILMEGRWNPLWFLLDDSRFSDITPSGLEKDYEAWLGDRRINFITDWLWHTRNRAWNFESLFNKPDGKQYIVQEIKNTLVHRGHPVKLSDDYGFMQYDNFAGLKWITKDGTENWWTYSGVKISQDYSIFGVMALYYRIGTSLYYKYSKCVSFKFFGKEFWYTFKYHANNKTGTIHLKIQWEKNV